MCYCIDRKLVIVNSEIELQFIPPTTILAECTHDLNPSIQDSWGLIYNYNKIWVRAAVWVRKWIDGSDQVSESLLTTALGMGPSQDWALQVVNCLCLVWPAGQRNTQKLILSSQLHSKSKYLVSLTILFSWIIKICSPLTVWHHHVMYAYVRTTAMV